jgi:hypothetical protein
MRKQGFGENLKPLTCIYAVTKQVNMALVPIKVWLNVQTLQDVVKRTA